MNRLTIVSIIVTTLLFIGCGQNEQSNSAAKSEPAKSETIAEKATKAVQAVKESASSAVAKTAEVAKKTTHEVTETAKKAVEATKEAVAKATGAPSAKYAKCAGCHGKDGKTKALGKSAVIAGQPKADLVKKMKEYKAGTRNVAGMGSLMKGQVASLSDADIDAIATYISGLK